MPASSPYSRYTSLRASFPMYTNHCNVDNGHECIHFFHASAYIQIHSCTIGPNFTFHVGCSTSAQILELWPVVNVELVAKHLASCQREKLREAMGAYRSSLNTKGVETFHDSVSRASLGRITPGHLPCEEANRVLWERILLQWICFSHLLHKNELFLSAVIGKRPRNYTLWRRGLQGPAQPIRNCAHLLPCGAYSWS